jgi:hypothetical protein
MKRITLLIMIAIAALSVASAHAADAPVDLSRVLGVCHVDGKYFLTKDDYLNEGADKVLTTGTKVIKLYLVSGRYPWNSDWPKDLKSMTDVAMTPYFQSVFAKPFETYILTAYSVGLGDNYWTAGISDDQAAQETQQFYDLTKYLLTTYKGTGKTFVLQHWEGDWAIRAGQGKAYDAKIVPSPTAVDGMIKWLNARQAGIVKARNEIKDSNVHVYGATEVNRIEDAMVGMPVVANAVLPHTTVDLVSYSCYNFLDSADHLSQGIDYLVDHLPPTAVFGHNAHSVYLGEFGYPENGDQGIAGVNKRLNVVFDVVKSRQLPWATYWEVYCNEINPNTNPTTQPTPPFNGKQNDKTVFGYWMIKPDGVPGMAWHRYRQMLITNDPTRATADAVKSKLTPIFTADFNRPDSTDLGPAWTQHSHYGVVNQQIKDHHLLMDIPDGHQTPWGSATLDLTNKAILGRGLVPGEYFEFTLQRKSPQGMMGVELFDSDQLRQGCGKAAGPTAMHAWGGTWYPFSINDRGDSLAFDWNVPHVLGVRFDSSDGHSNTFSYYIDGNYAGSWLVNTGNKMLNKIGVYSQSDTAGSAFDFSQVNIFGRK